MQAQHRGIEDAIGACYDAVLAPDMLSGALHDLARSFGAVGCSLHTRDAGRARLALPSSPVYRDFLADFVREGWWRDDHRARRGWPLAERGRRILLEHDVASDEERRSLPQYADLYRRHDVPWWSAVMFRVEDRMWAAPFLRSATQGPFEPRDVPDLERLAPHLARIVRLAEAFCVAAATAAADALAHSGRPAILADAAGLLFYANPPAELILRAGGPLRVIRGHVTVFEPDAAAALAHHIAETAAGRPPALPLVVRRAEGRPLLVDAAPVAESLGMPSPARVLLTVTDPDAERPADAARIRLALGLTAAETRLAAHLGAGRSLGEAATRLSVTEETARTTLKRVFAKAGVARQGELVALLARIAGG